MRTSLTQMAAVAAATAILGLAGGATAADYPSKPVQVIVTYSAGGSTDTLMRVFAKHAEKYLGTNIVVVNRPGAGGIIGWTLLVNSKADGYTMSNLNLPSMTTKPIAQPDDVTFRPSDFRPIANLVTDPGVIAVRADGDIKTLEQLLDKARKDPDGTTISHEGVGGDDHLALLELQRATGVQFNMVAFDGNAPATAALLGGHIVAFEGNMSEVVQQIEDGTVRALAIWADERNPAIPDVPTGKELGIDVVSGSSRGLTAPAGVPEEVLAKWDEVLAKVAADPEFVKAVENLQMPLNVVTSDGYGKMIERSYEVYKQIWDEKPWIEQ